MRGSTRDASRDTMRDSSSHTTRDLTKGASRDTTRDGPMVWSYDHTAVVSDSYRFSFVLCHLFVFKEYFGHIHLGTFLLLVALILQTISLTL